MLSEAAIVLRREFDLSFAEVRRTETPDMQHLMAVRVGGDPYAMRVDEIGGLFVDRRVVPVPTPMSELLGVAGFRGQVAPVYDLAALLGYPRRPGPRWLILVRHRQFVALAFDAFEGQLAAAPDQLVPLTGTALHGALPERSALRSHIDYAVCGEGAARPIIRLSSVIEEIQRRTDVARYAKEL